MVATDDDVLVDLGDRVAEEYVLGAITRCDFVASTAHSMLYCKNRGRLERLASTFGTAPVEKSLIFCSHPLFLCWFQPGDWPYIRDMILHGEV